LGQDEDLTATLKAAQLEQSLRGELGAPHIGRLDQRVSVAAELARESNDAFEEQRALLEAGLSRPYGERWKIGGGGELSYLETEENAVTTTNILVAFPFFVTYDGSNKFLIQPRASSSTFALNLRRSLWRIRISLPPSRLVDRFISGWAKMMIWSWRRAPKLALSRDQPGIKFLPDEGSLRAAAVRSVASNFSLSAP
jgi:hypothetical protein